MEDKVSIVKKTEEVVIKKTSEEIVIDENVGKDHKVEYAFVRDAFFEQYFNDPDQILDKEDDKNTRENRVYVCIKIELDENTYLIPLRKNLGKIVRNPKYNKVYYKVPSTTKPDAGLDFRKMIVVNNPALYMIDEAKISSKQRKTIEKNIEEIIKLANDYVKGFKKVAKKGRQKKEALYCFSALNNFLDELNVKKNN